MNTFKGYILQSELAEKANVSNSLFRQLNNLQFKKMGNYTCILKDSLPLEYKEIAEKECLDLEYYRSFAFISKELGMCEDYMFQVERHKHIDHARIKGVKLFKLSDDFLSHLKNGFTPFKIKLQKDIEYAKEVIEMQGLKIGFY